MLGGGDDAVEVAEGREQRLGERLHVDARDGVEEQELEQLVFRHRRVAAGEEARAQALAVAPVVRARPSEAGRRGARRRQPQLELVEPAHRLLGKARPVGSSPAIAASRRIRAEGGTSALTGR